jgi:hypothetical protein
VSAKIGRRRRELRSPHPVVLSGSTDVDGAGDYEPDKPGDDDGHCYSSSRSQIALPKGLVIAWLVALTTQQRYQGWVYVCHAARSATLLPQWKVVRYRDFFTYLGHVIPPSALVLELVERASSDARCGS